MKLISLSILLILSSSLFGEEKQQYPRQIDEFLKPFLPKGWKSIYDSRSLTIYKEKKVRFLNPVSLPPDGLESLFKEFGWDDHMVIRLHFIPKLSEEELKSIRLVRKKEEEKIKNDKTMNGKTKYGKLFTITDKFPVPNFYNHSFSIYLHRTDKGLFYMSPQSAEEEKELILEKLNQVIKKYEP